MLITENKFNQFKQQHPLESLKAALARDVLFKNLMYLNLPTKKTEAWKFTSVQNLKNYEWNLQTEADADVSLLSHDEMTQVSQKCKSEFHNLVFVNGKLNKTLSDSDIEFSTTDLTEADYQVSNSDTELYFKSLGRAVGTQKIIFNFAKKSILEKPLQIISVVSNKQNTLQNLNFHFELAEFANAKIIFHLMSLDSQTQAKHMQNISVTANIENHAGLKFIYLENNSTQNFHFSQVEFTLNDFSNLVFLDLGLGSELSRHYMQTRFAGENANAGLYAVNLLADTQHTDHYTYIWHEKGLNNSIQHYKSILADKSHSVFRGRIKIDPNAQKANSEQLNNNLLLSKAASADSVPQLEIYADDVKAGHGSTIGQLNNDEVFYFLSRGISKAQALKMLSYGYAKELIYKLENSEIEDFLFHELEQKLEGIF